MLHLLHVVGRNLHGNFNGVHMHATWRVRLIAWLKHGVHMTFTWQLFMGISCCTVRPGGKKHTNEIVRVISTLWNENNERIEKGVSLNFHSLYYEMEIWGLSFIPSSAQLQFRRLMFNPDEFVVLPCALCRFNCTVDLFSKSNCFILSACAGDILSRACTYARGYLNIQS